MASPLVADTILRALREGLLLVLLVSAPPLLAILVVGIVAGAVQSATQIQDPSVVFVPKLVVCVVVLFVSAPLLGGQVIRFARALLGAVAAIR